MPEGVVPSGRLCARRGTIFLSQTLSIGRVAMAKTRNALKILERVTGDSKSIKAGIAQAKINLEVAQMIYDARTKAGLSQTELATLIGSKQPVIARLEDADY
jgi:ribosome-binding protein aMBF1 (putative translation factor)